MSKIKLNRDRLRQEYEERELLSMISGIGSVLKELWDNKKDSAYDEI